MHVPPSAALALQLTSPLLTDWIWVGGERRRRQLGPRLSSLAPFFSKFVTTVRDVLCPEITHLPEAVTRRPTLRREHAPDQP